VVIADGAGNVKQLFTSTGGLSFGSALNFGAAGQLLQSNGAGASPSWVSTGTFSLGATEIVSTVTSSALLSGFAVTLPNSQTYTTATSRQFMDVYVDGYKLVKGVDYTEINNTSYTPLISIPVGSTIEYRIS
jgi:hypothetical protein